MLCVLKSWLKLPTNASLLIIFTILEIVVSYDVLMSEDTYSNQDFMDKYRKELYNHVSIKVKVFEFPYAP